MIFKVYYTRRGVNMVDKEQIGVRISGLRKKAGISQATLAEKLGVSAQAVSKWENGNNLPDIDVFRELAWIFETTIDNIVEGDFSFSEKNVKNKLPGNIRELALNAERSKLLESLVPYCSNIELYNIAKELNSGNLELSVAAHIAKHDEKVENTVYLSPEALEKSTIHNIAPYFAKALSNHLGNIDPGLKRITDLLVCPKCNKKLSLVCTDDNLVYYSCENGHRYEVVDGVIDFGSREILGELWSLHFKNYESYLLEQRHPGNPRYQMGKIPCCEVRWQEIKKRKPRVILDIACGIGSGLKYDLQRINWPCLVIMTDLSHRVLKYNKKYFSEEMVNPYVDIVCVACDCSQLPIADNCIDVVVSNAGFESMQNKMMEGFSEGYRILKNSGSAIYNISVVDDHNSENTQKWMKLINSIDELSLLLDSVYDIKEWEQICLKTGYKFTEVKQIYSELPAPNGERFPFENEIMQWMSEYLCVSCK